MHAIGHTHGHTPLLVCGGPASLKVWIPTRVRGPNQTSKFRGSTLFDGLSLRGVEGNYFKLLVRYIGHTHGHTPLLVYGGPASLKVWIQTRVRGPNQTSYFEAKRHGYSNNVSKADLFLPSLQFRPFL